MALVVAGCGGNNGDDQSGRDQRIRDCIQTAQTRAEVELVSRLYREGELGTAAQVRREVSALEVPGLDPTPFLREDGSLPGWSELDDGQRRTLYAWKEFTLRVRQVVGQRDALAGVEARRRAQQSCV